MPIRNSKDGKKSCQQRALLAASSVNGRQQGQALPLKPVTQPQQTPQVHV